MFGEANSFITTCHHLISQLARTAAFQDFECVCRFLFRSFIRLPNYVHALVIGKQMAPALHFSGTDKFSCLYMSLLIDVLLNCVFLAFD
jgi:hypothetical protein